MKQLILITFLVAIPLSGAIADDGGKTLASTLEVYVFPTEGQASDQQSKDEAECYDWAASNTGSDPFELQKQSEQQQQQTEQQVAQAQGASAKGAVKGAAAGALIGEVSGGDAGDSAAIGAAAGAVASRRRGRAANSHAQEEGAAQQQASAEQVDNFKKAFSVYLEAKEYMVKF